MARYLLAALLLPASLTLAWLILRRPFREICEEIRFEKARERFRMSRERLEAKFVAKAAALEPESAERWHEAQWQDGVVWARDRKSRVLLALIGVHFDIDPFSGEPARYATALFEFRRDGWMTEGRGLDEVRPDEVFLMHHRLEPIVFVQHRPTRAGGTI